MSANATELLAQIAELAAKIDPDSDDVIVAQKSDADQIWILIAGFLVFFMHAGFTMLEVGSVRHRNAVNILFKNIGTISIGAIMYFLVGYGLAFGQAATDNFNSFIGNDPEAFANQNMGNDGRHFFFFQFAFAATAATIVSGAVAGRINLMAYFIIAIYLTAFVYPIVTHWVWATGGWLSAFQDDTVAPVNFIFDDSCGMIDFAGSGVVHMTGGVAAFFAALILGPRIGRYDSEGTPTPIAPHNISLQALGVFILWFGWYGFNCGSTLAFAGESASKVAVTTTLAPAAAVCTAIVLGRVVNGHFDIALALNSALAGLVSITAPCPVVADWAAILIGAIGAVIYFGASKLMVKIKVDDPVDAIAVHGVCGAWGVISVALFMNESDLADGYGCELRRGQQLGIQIIGVLTIFAWVAATTVPLYLGLKAAGILRVSEEEEEAGLDVSEHGGSSVFVGGDAVAAKTSAVSPQA